MNLSKVEQEKKPISLIKNIILFFVANFMPKAITFFMLPLYTYCLSTEEYGMVDIFIITLQLLLPILTIQVQDAMLRFSLEKKNNPSDVLTIGLRIVLIGSLLLFVACNLGIVTGIIKIDLIYIIIFFIMYLLHAFKNIASYFCRGIDKIAILTVSNIIITLAIVLANLLFLLVFKWGVLGYLLSLCLGNLIGVLILFFGAKLYKYIKMRISNKELVKKIILFSLPMVFSALSWWVNTSMDKYILGYFYGTSAVGLLAVAYKIPSILSLFGITIANAYAISAIKDFDKDDTDGFLGKSYSMINLFFVFICSVLMILNVFLAKFMFADDFFEAWKLVPPLLLSALVSQLSLTCEQYYVAIKKTSIISVTAVVGACINTVFNLLIIPKYGAYGAAVATAFSFFAVWLIRYSVLGKYVKLKHNFFVECISYILLIIQLALAYSGNRFILYQIIIMIVIITLYIRQIKKIIFTAFRFFDHQNERTKL